MTNVSLGFPKVVEFIVPVQSALRRLNNPCTGSEIFVEVSRIMGLTDAQIQFKDSIGRSKAKNLQAWAIVRLKKHGYVDGTSHFGYSLTQKGRDTDIGAPQALMRD